jgi:hypothetical protein
VLSACSTALEMNSVLPPPVEAEAGPECSGPAPRTAPTVRGMAPTANRPRRIEGRMIDDMARRYRGRFTTSPFLGTKTGFVLFARTPGHGACSPWHWAQETCRTFLGAESQYRNRLWRYTNLHSGRDHREPEALTTSPEGLGPFTHEGSLIELSPVNGVMNAGVSPDFG